MVEICNSRSVTVVLNPSDGSRLAVLSAGPSSRVSSWRENSGGPSRPSHSCTWPQKATRLHSGVKGGAQSSFHAWLNTRRLRVLPAGGAAFIFISEPRLAVSRGLHFHRIPLVHVRARIRTHTHTHVCKLSYLGKEFLHCGLRQPLRFMRSRRVSSQQPINCCLVFATSL